MKYTKANTLKNTTIGELIKILQEYNQDAVACFTTVYSNDEFEFSTIEAIKEIPNVSYVDDDGNYKQGDVVIFY